MNVWQKSTSSSFKYYNIIAFFNKNTWSISPGLWLEIMIFIQLVVCFLSPSLGSWIENTQVGWKLYPTTNHGRFFLSHVTTSFLSLVAFEMQLFLTSFQKYCMIIHCDVIGKVYENIIPWMISTAYVGKHVININYRIGIHIKDLASDWKNDTS